MLEPQDLVFRARALAQAHPLTPLATRFVKRAVNQEQASQPSSEFGIWAGGALIDGYCLRRVEEGEDGTEAHSLGGVERRPPAAEGVGAPPDPAAGGLTPAAGGWSTPDGADPLDHLDDASSRIASELRTGLTADQGSTVAALDRLIGSAVERRLDHLRDDVDAQAWVELGEYLTWWVVKGYALRVAEC